MNCPECGCKDYLGGHCIACDYDGFHAFLSLMIRVACYAFVPFVMVMVACFFTSCSPVEANEADSKVIADTICTLPSDPNGYCVVTTYTEYNLGPSGRWRTVPDTTIIFKD